MNKERLLEKVAQYHNMRQTISSLEEESKELKKLLVSQFSYGDFVVGDYHVTLLKVNETVVPRHKISAHDKLIVSKLKEAGI